LAGFARILDPVARRVSKVAIRAPIRHTSRPQPSDTVELEDRRADHHDHGETAPERSAQCRSRRCRIVEIGTCCLSRSL
jgi:hypothetical protein